MVDTPMLTQLFCAKNDAELDDLISQLSEPDAKQLLKNLLSMEISDRKRRQIEQGYVLAEDGSVISSPLDNLTPEQQREVELSFDTFVRQAITDTANEYRREHGLPPLPLEDIPADGLEE